MRGRGKDASGRTINGTQKRWGDNARCMGPSRNMIGWMKCSGQTELRGMDNRSEDLTGPQYRMLLCLQHGHADSVLGLSNEVEKS